MSLRLFYLALLATSYATPLDLTVRDECKPCTPEGATGIDPPEIGPDLKSMYIDLLDTVKDIHFRKRETGSISARADGFCCVLDCVNVQNLNVPMCYDKFTTQYAFPDGSYGSLTTGNYTQDGTVVNLVLGNYTKADGQTGNIYSEDPGAKPNTATLSIPPQFTASGVGSAIPATELASIVHQTASSGLAQTTAATTTSAVASSQTLAAASSSSTAAAGQISADRSASFGMSIFSALMYAIYAL